MTRLPALLNRSRVACRLPAKSQKNLFEILAQRIAADHPALEEEVIAKQLLAREKLGSTGLGKGIAVPHSRMRGLEEPVGFLLTTQSAVSYDSPDDAPVDILFALLVPEECTQLHLDLLAEIATLLSDPGYCRALRGAATPDELLASAIPSQAA